MTEKEYEYEIACGDDEKIAVFLHALDTDVFPGIDFEKYRISCDQRRMEYPSELLNAFHQAFTSAYGSNPITESDAEWIVAPALLCSRKTGNILVGLVELDLSSSGEHWGTNFLTPFGMYNPDEDRTGKLPNYMREVFGQYDYYYTPDIPGDIHVDWSKCPDEVRNVIEACRNTAPEQTGDMKLT